jgi:hypothetical protein
MRINWTEIIPLVRQLVEEWDLSAGRKTRLLMYEDFFPDFDDPQYIEKVRALYPDIPDPENWLDLGFETVYPPILIPLSKRFLRRLKEAIWKEWTYVDRMR